MFADFPSEVGRNGFGLRAKVRTPRTAYPLDPVTMIRLPKFTAGQCLLQPTCQERSRTPLVALLGTPSS